MSNSNGLNYPCIAMIHGQTVNFASAAAAVAGIVKATGSVIVLASADFTIMLPQAGLWSMRATEVRVVSGQISAALTAAGAPVSVIG
jgi:hypothetical protein